MNNHKKDRDILRSLAERYAEIAKLDVQKERLDRYNKTIAMEQVRPVVLIDEVPWGEISDDDLTLKCENREFHWLEERLRKALYQWDRFQADMVLPSTFRVQKKIDSTSIGIEVQDRQILSNTGTYAASHSRRT